jgi:hypothetical protein
MSNPHINVESLVMAMKLSATLPPGSLEHRALELVSEIAYRSTPDAVEEAKRRIEEE